MEAMENKTVVDATEEIVTASSKGCLKKLGIIGGVAALCVAGYFVVKKVRSNKDEAIDADVDMEDVELLDEEIASEED